MIEGDNKNYRVNYQNQTLPGSKEEVCVFMKALFGSLSAEIFYFIFLLGELS